MSEFRLPQEYNSQLANKKIEKTAYYSHDLVASGPNITVKALKGVIELKNFDIFSSGGPNPGCASTIQIGITNPRLNQKDADRVYIQVTPYYSPAFDDLFVPYLMPSGVLLLGSAITIYNVSNEPVGANQAKGEFYINYEIYSF